jgi:hypothetical protein
MFLEHLARLFLGHSDALSGLEGKVKPSTSLVTWEPYAPWSGPFPVASTTRGGMKSDVKGSTERTNEKKTNTQTMGTEEKVDQKRIRQTGSQIAGTKEGDLFLFPEGELDVHGRVRYSWEKSGIALKFPGSRKLGVVATRTLPAFTWLPFMGHVYRTYEYDPILSADNMKQRILDVYNKQLAMQFIRIRLLGGLYRPVMVDARRGRDAYKQIGVHGLGIAALIECTVDTEKANMERYGAWYVTTRPIDEGESLVVFVGKLPQSDKSDEEKKKKPTRHVPNYLHYLLKYDMEEPYTRDYAKVRAWLTAFDPYTPLAAISYLDDEEEVDENMIRPTLNSMYEFDRDDGYGSFHVPTIGRPRRHTVKARGGACKKKKKKNSVF